MARSNPHLAVTMADDRNEQNSNFLAGVAFAALLAALVAGVWAFPKIYAYMSQQDCIASGRTNCIRYGPPDVAPPP
jgi:hypothetical protein